MLWADTETYCEYDLRKVGLYNYAPFAEIMLFPYAIGDGDVQMWDLTENAEMPADLRHELMETDNLVVFHNAQFDWTIIKHALDYEIPLERVRCTMVRAYLHGFPGALSDLGAALGLPADKQKLRTGKNLINKFCGPAPKNHKAHRYDKASHPLEWDQFCDYALQDVGTMRWCAKRLPNWNSTSRAWEEWRLDQKINARGFQVDTELVAAGAQNSVDEKESLRSEFRTLTDGAVDRPSQREKFRIYLNETFDLALDDTQSATFQALLDSGTLPPKAERLLQISIMANKSSTAKYAKLKPAVSPDGRFRGGLQFAGAARTRRWAGRTFQPHNLPSRGLPPQSDIDDYIEALKLGVVGELFDETMLLASAALRGVLTAPEGKELNAADLSNIEGRAAAWLAGEQWKLDAFRAYDSGEGPDLYKVAVSRIMGVPVEKVTRKNRDAIGKVSELASAYEGGVGAYQKFAPGKMAEHWDVISASVGERIIERAEYNREQDWAQEWLAKIGPKEWLASECVKLAWRKRHPAITALWSSLRDAATKAIRNPGKRYRAGPRLWFVMREFAGDEYLLMHLPSGYYLVYYQPEVHPKTLDLSYMGHRGTLVGTNVWRRVPTYGGKFLENACQSISRDVLCRDMFWAEKAGYEIVLTVHDELVTEAEEGRGVEELVAIMSRTPDWAPDFPIAADGFTATRYRK